MTCLRLRMGVYYYRTRVPVWLRPFVRQREFTWSLRTRDDVLAQALALEMRASWLRLKRALRHASAAMNAAQIDELVRRYVDSFWNNREEDAVQYGPLDSQQTLERRNWLNTALKDAEESLAANRLESVQRLAVELLREEGYEVDEEGEPFRRLCFRLLYARVDLLRQDASRMPSPGMKATEPRPVDSPKLSQLVADYLKHRDTNDPMRPNSRLETESALSAMVDLMGDVPFASVRNRDAQDYATKFAQLPKRWRQMYRGRTATSVMEETKVMNIACIEPATFNKEVGLVKAFWAWACVREERASNPMLAVKPKDVGNVKAKRKPFTDLEIVRLAPVIDGERATRPERYWVTTLLAYTGARLEEIAQLRTEDVQVEDGILCVHILDEAGSVKGGAGSSSERVVPIHSAVIAKGFLEYVKSRPNGRLWSDDERSSYGAPISKWFGRVLDGLQIEDRKKKGLHSFRHVIRDKLLAGGVDGVTRREILGHAHEDVEDKVYGDPSGVAIAVKKAAIERISLPL